MTHFLKPIYLLLTTLVFLITAAGNAQIVLNAPQPADNPNLPGNSPWTAACASDGFNQYFVEISWAGTANAGNSFILELSDTAGSFASPTELNTVSNQNTNNPFLMEFALPTDAGSSNYKLRVRSTSPAQTSPEAGPYNMYFMSYMQHLNISVLGDGVPPGSICASSAFTLQVDNLPNPENYSYIWYRSGTELAGEKGHTLNVTQSGMYVAYIDYGPICTGSANTDSNIVDVTFGGTTQGIAIAPPSKTELCPGDTETLSINITDPAWSYKWYKNGTAIAGATASTYTVDSSIAGFEGDYQVEISGTGVCTERSAAVTMSAASSFTITLGHDPNIVLLPAQTKTLSITTNATSPTYQWYMNGTAINGATNASLDVTAPGTYYIEVTATSGGCGGTLPSENINVVIPSSFELIIAAASDYAACTSTSTVLSVEQINAILSNGTSLDVTSDVESSFSFQWMRAGNPVSGATTNALSLASNAENDSYSLDGTLSTYSATSNTIDIQLLTNETVTINSSSTAFCSASDPITITTSTDLSASTFAWEQDGTIINTTDASLSVTAQGTYRLGVNRDGCTLYSNEIVIAPLDDSIIVLDSDVPIVFPEGSSKTVTASGGTGYTWYDASNTVIGTSDTITLTAEGNYTLVATVDNCEVTKAISVEYLDTFNVPNVITPNGDGANDQWVLPNSYSNKQDVNVIIYNDRGEEVLNEMGYQNTWPTSTLNFQKQNMVFYYVIKNATKTLKKGTITVIR